MPVKAPAADVSWMEALLTQSELSMSERVPDVPADRLNHTLTANCGNLSRALLKYGNSSFDFLELSKKAHSLSMPFGSSVTPSLYIQRPLVGLKSPLNFKHVILTNSGTPATTPNICNNTKHLQQHQTFATTPNICKNTKHLQQHQTFATPNIYKNTKHQNGITKTAL